MDFGVWTVHRARSGTSRTFCLKRKGNHQNWLFQRHSRWNGSNLLRISVQRQKQHAMWPRNYVEMPLGSIDYHKFVHHAAQGKDFDSLPSTSTSEKRLNYMVKVYVDDFI